MSRVVRETNANENSTDAHPNCLAVHVPAATLLLTLRHISLLFAFQTQQSLRVITPLAVDSVQYLIRAQEPVPSRLMLRPSSEGVNPAKYCLAPEIVPKSSSNMKRDKVLPVNSNLFVNRKGLLGDLRVCFLCPRDSRGEKRKTFSTKVTHCNACGRHDPHETIKSNVRDISKLHLNRSASWEMRNRGKLRCIHQPVSQSRCHQNTSQ
mmetsp:Transcript_49796/g.149796  ORF Transcript_49796/g.149796 Transcript_49796/m.149796 type:complete len:208 (+) Transcript_49796:190-813(+)